MALDSAAKRLSMLNMHAYTTLPLPTGSVTLAERQHLLALYASSDLDDPPVDPGARATKLRRRRARQRHYRMR